MSNHSTRNVNFSSGEILEDSSGTGKKRKWSQYKQQAIAVADGYNFFDYLSKYAIKISDCGSWLRFARCPQGHLKRLVAASFCKCRLCTLCQWRKSLVMFHQTLALVHAHKGKHASDVPLLLTLTVPNVSAEGLPAHLDMMTKAWDKLMKRRNVKPVIRAWFRALEITYNKARKDYHPHFHILLMVPKNYFDKRFDFYINHEEWLAMWQEVTGISDITQVDIRRVRKRSRYDALASASAEIAKYATKPGSYISGDIKNGFVVDDPKVIETLHLSLKNRRLAGFGGEFKKLRSELKQADVENTDLVNVSDEYKGCVCEVCQSTLIEEMFHWHAGVREYVG